MFARACSIAADQARRLELRPGARSLPQRPRMTSEAPRLLRQPLESATGHLQRTLPPGKCATRVDTGAETRPGQARRARGISLPVGLVPRRLTDRASAATDSADRQHHATEVPTPECYRTQERPAVCCQLQALVGRRAVKLCATALWRPRRVRIRIVGRKPPLATPARSADTGGWCLVGRAAESAR